MANFVPEQQLKILILLALKSAKAPLPLTALTDIPASCDINCLSVQLCVNELLEQKHIIQIGDFVKISETGKIIIKELENDAPLSLRKKITAATTIKLTELRRELNVKTEITEKDSDFDVTLILLDGGSELFKFSFICPTKTQAETCARTFKEQPTEVFRKFLGVLVKEDI
ncbi:MAG: hypothetical protein DBX47_00525 [Clostridiales bacterium]|nr:MAG: hypothetical protein DBX47_00525 [Clostridiales bacterium]